MKKIIAILTALLLTIAATAQRLRVGEQSSGMTLNVKVGNVTYQFPASQTGDMPFASGTSLTIMGKTFATADISGISIDNSEVTNNLVSVIYDGTTASVSVAGRYSMPTWRSESGSMARLTVSACAAAWASAWRM